MAGYGFRLFNVLLGKNFTQNPQPEDWSTVPSGPYEVRAKASVDRLVQSGYRLHGKPGFRDGRSLSQLGPYLNPGKGSAVLRWFPCKEGSAAPGETPRGSRHIGMEIAYGRHGSHELGITSSTTEDLGDVTPSNRFRAELFVPSAGAGHGLLVVETIGRTCPVESFIRWLAVEDDISSGHVDPLRLFADPVVDRGHLQQLLGQAKKVEVRLKGQPARSSGIKTSVGHFDLTLNVLQSSHNKLMRLLSGKTGQVKPQQVLTLLNGQQDLSDLEFGDGSFVIETPDERKTLAFDALSEVFTYPTTADLAPTPEKWMSEVRTKMGSLGYTDPW